MGVKTEDITFNGTNEDLALVIASLIVPLEDSKGLLPILETKFSEIDSETIYNWIKPNIRKLIALSRNLATCNA